MSLRPCVLIILDGWGIAPAGPGNAIALAETPVMDGLWATSPHSTLAASGLAVGLPEGQIGNSEVGHLNLGAGYRVLQELPRIDEEIESGRFFENPALTGAVDYALRRDATLHLLGLFSYGGVHSHARHLYALLEIAARKGLRRVAVHAFLDGRDTPPRQALEDLPQLEEALARTGVGRIATVSGRYFAMDRDKRWDRVERAYRALVIGEGERAPTAEEAVRRAYGAGQGDEFVPPTIIAPDEGGGEPGDGLRGTIGDGDAVIWFDFRADRARELSQALLLPDFDGFPRPRTSADLHYVTFTQYASDLPVTAVAFPPQHVEWPLARVVSEAGLRQCHLAETEKYAHVTYFFNGGREEPFPGEERVLVPSPRVATYDLQPEMSAAGVAAAAVQRIAQGDLAFLVLNFANGDMVGHTGVLEAAILAASATDQAVGRVVRAALEAGGMVAVTADHGNAEEMIDPRTGGPMTAHTTNDVPFILAGAPLPPLPGSLAGAAAPLPQSVAVRHPFPGRPLRGLDPGGGPGLPRLGRGPRSSTRAGAPGRTRLAPEGALKDVAPTLLALLDLPIPAAMAGNGLLQSGSR